MFKRTILKGGFPPRKHILPKSHNTLSHLKNFTACHSFVNLFFFPGKYVFIDKVWCVCAGKSRLMITMPAPCCWLCNVGDQRQRACQFPPLECLHVQDVRRSHLTIHNIMTQILFVFTITREPL